jgi:Terminase small subunit
MPRNAKPKTEKKRTNYVGKFDGRMKEKKTERTLTSKQERFMEEYMKSRELRSAALLAGYSKNYPSQSGAQALKAIKSICPEVMDEVGLTLDALIKKHLIPLLFATETKFAMHKGKFKDERTVEALQIQLGATRMAFELRGAFPQQQSESQHYGGIDTIIIDIPRPDYSIPPKDVPASPLPQLKKPKTPETPAEE